ncbi:HET-domain-containing protein [Daldinia sp. FL1419]|nr:HET-domain-containing protein [Daldinia sp. FL1419]
MKNAKKFKRRSLPARVLDVGSKPTDSVGLLRVADRREDTYACLSHYWGKPKKGDTPITLAIQSEASLKQGVPIDKFPMNYQDAIRFYRLLGIRYLWIEALCIIQDSAEDWTCESLEMASYYRYRTICLAATRSPDRDGGSRPIKTRVEYQLPGVGGPRGRILVTEKPLGVPHFWLAKNFPYDEYYPLLTRAWMYQERRLSPRL